MKPETIVLPAVFLVLVLCQGAQAEPRMLAGTEEGTALIASGAADTVLAPGRLVNEIGEDVNNFGVGGLVTGTVAGGIKGAGQAVAGAGRMLIGILDVLTKPVRESSYHRKIPQMR